MGASVLTMERLDWLRVKGQGASGDKEERCRQRLGGVDGPHH